MSKGARSTAVAQREVLARAVAAGNSGNLSEAERIVREILSKTPQHPDALQLLGVLLLGQKRPREAVAPLEEAARNTANPELETIGDKRGFVRWHAFEVGLDLNGDFRARHKKGPPRFLPLLLSDGGAHLNIRFSRTNGECQRRSKNTSAGRIKNAST
jgi:hypothetical protein